LPSCAIATVYDDDFSFDDYDMLVLPGGIPGNAQPQGLRFPHRRPRSFCRGWPPDRGHLCGTLDSCRAGTSYESSCHLHPNFQHVLAEHGAKLCEHDPVVVDGNIITSQGMGTAIAFGLQIVRHFLGDTAVDRVSSGIVLHP